MNIKMNKTLAIFLFAIVLVSVFEQYSATAVIPACVNVGKCVDFIVTQSINAISFQTLWPASIVDGEDIADANFVGGNPPTKSTPRGNLQQASTSTPYSTTAWWSTTRGFNPCPFPACPYGWVTLPSNASRCTPASGFTNGQGVVMDAFTSLSDCLGAANPGGLTTYPLDTYSFRTRTCMSEFNKQFKNCLAYQGILG